MQLKAATKHQPRGEARQQKTTTTKTPTGKKISNCSPDKVRKVAAQNQKRQQQQARPKTPTTPEKPTN